MKAETTDIRVGTGWDIHPLAEGIPFVLGGVHIENNKGSVAHSDGDVLIHAITDALLGAACLGDIGLLFPDSDAKFKNISSLILLKQTAELLSKHGWKIINIDSTVILQHPKLSPYISRMRTAISQTLGLDEKCISIKAKTAEHLLGELGSADAVIAQAAALIRKD